METIIVKVDKKEDVAFLRKLLKKLNFRSEVKVSKSSDDRKSTTSELISSIQWATSTPSIQDFAGIWKDRNISLERLRERAWKRN